jgi:hypothetical protein
MRRRSPILRRALPDAASGRIVEATQFSGRPLIGNSVNKGVRESLPVGTIRLLYDNLPVKGGRKEEPRAPSTDACDRRRHSPGAT